MKKLIVASALALTTLAGLATSLKVQTSSTAKYSIKQYKSTKKYGRGSVTFSYQLPQLKGKSAATKKINKDLRNAYMDKAKYKNALFADAKTAILEDGHAFPFKDITKSNVTYNSKNVISIRWTYYYRHASSSNLSIGGWTYSLKTGKKLNIFDVSQGSKKYIKTRLYNAALKFGATESELSNYHTSKVNFFLKHGKVYAYPSILVSTATKSIVFNSRYK